MINNLIRGLLYVIVFVLLQVLFLNNIHFLTCLWASPGRAFYCSRFSWDCWSTFLGIRRECMPSRRHLPASAVSR